MKHVIALMGLFMVMASGCGTMDGPRPPKQSWKIPQHNVNALVDCDLQVPNVKGIYDPLTGYHLFEGADAGKYRQCLKTKYGWFELGPPKWAPGTMAPPR